MGANAVLTVQGKGTKYVPHQVHHAVMLLSKFCLSLEQFTLLSLWMAASLGNELLFVPTQHLEIDISADFESVSVRSGHCSYKRFAYKANGSSSVMFVPSAFAFFLGTQ